MRRYADVSAYVNFTVFKEILYLDGYLLRSLMSNFEKMSERSIKNITSNHCIWVDLLTKFTDIKKALALETA